MMRLASTSLLLVSFLHLLLFVPTIHAILCIEKEKHALLDFKLSFVDDPYDALSTWRIDSIDCCDWYQVACDEDTGHVISLDLDGGLKSYQLRHSLLELRHLTVFGFRGNQFPMKLPKFIGSLTNLIHLDLSGSEFFEIGSLQQLFVLHLSNNNFSGELPLSMRNCTQLKILELANNNFTGAVPFWIGESIPQLIALTLTSNNFVGELPFSLCHLQRLQILDLSDNQILGCIPRCLHNFTTMSTNIRSDINVIGDYASITWKGVLAEFYSQNLDQRNVINLSSNLLQGEIPTELTALKMLRSLDLSRNALNGSIPDKIGQLTSLEVLLLSSNRLSGEIPESLASLTFLDKLNLSNNNLSGRIPIGTQLQSFSASSYAGNPKLCGDPLSTKCPGDEDVNKNQPPSSKNAHVEDDESFDIQVFSAALGMGFAVTFLGVLGILHFIHPWRLAFFKLSENIADMIFVVTSLFPSRIKGRLCSRKVNGAPNM